MSGQPPFAKAPGNTLGDRSKQRDAVAAKRAAMAAKLAAVAAKRHVEPLAPPPRPQRDPARFTRSLAAVPFYAIGEEAALAPAPAYLKMVEAALDAMNAGGVHILLCWPPQQPSLSALVSLLALADVEAAEKMEERRGSTMWKSAAPPIGMRALLYPYARSTHRTSRQVQVDGAYLGAIHLRHLARAFGAGDSDAALKDYHAVSGRAKTLTGLARDGRKYPEFKHPTLDEMVPHGNCDGVCHPNGELLWRTYSKTDLVKGLSRTNAADDGSKARFYLYGLSSTDRAGTVVRRIRTAPDIVIVDLTRTGRNRLGRNWVEIAKQTCATVREIHKDTGILVITDDPWAFDAARFEVFGTPGRGRKAITTPSPSSTIFMSSPAIIGVDDTTTCWRGAANFSVRGFSGDLPTVVAGLRTIANQLRDAGERRGVEPINQIVGKLRRAASLPGSLVEFSRYISGEAGDAFAADTMAGYRISGVVQDLQDPLRGIDQVGGDALRSVLRQASALLKTIEAATPMAGLLQEEVTPALRISSRTVFIFRSQMIAEFALDRFSTQMPKLPDRLESGMVNFTGPAGLTDISEMSEAKRNQHKRVVYVAPTREGILNVMAQPWLPDEITVLADVDTLRFAARDAERLAIQLGDHPVSKRLSRFAAEAAKEVQQRGSHIVALDTIVPPAEDVDFHSGAVINLAGSARGARDLLEIELESRQRIIARRGSGLVVREDTKAIAEFNEKPARDISVGDHVCAISTGFIEQARPLLNITATAADMIRDYHEDVITRFGALAGDTIEDRLRTLTAAMGEPAITTIRARYWVTLRGEVDKTLDEVVPHAPKDQETFLRFTGALGIAPRMAERFWAWAIIAQRASRLKAGFAFHEAYKGILTDPHAAIAANSGRAADIRRLRALAEDFVSTVQSVREFRQ